MIIGRLSDLDAHERLLPKVVFRALKTIRALDFATAAPGRFPLDGDALYYMLEERPMRTEQEHRAEAHARYADIHLPVSASERFGFALPQPGLAIVEDAIQSRDIAFYDNPANETFIVAEPGSYLFFAPGELHRPCLIVSNTDTVIRKIVVKIHRSLLGLQTG